MVLCAISFGSLILCTCHMHVLTCTGEFYCQSVKLTGVVLSCPMHSCRSCSVLALILVVVCGWFWVACILHSLAVSRFMLCRVARISHIALLTCIIAGSLFLSFVRCSAQVVVFSLLFVFLFCLLFSLLFLSFVVFILFDSWLLSFGFF